jgi:hypothetical protein
MGTLKSGVVMNPKTSGKADLDKYSMFKYMSLNPETKEIVKNRANKVIRLLHERSDERNTNRQPFGFNSALSLLLMLDTLKNQGSI